MKKKLIILAAVVVAAVAAVVCLVLFLPAGEAVFAQGYTVTAHTGCEGTQDNSLESITAAVEAGADIVEFDLNFDSRGVAVLAHDTPEGECVTLDEAFACVAQYEGVRVNVDIKAYDDLTQVVTLAQKHGIIDRIFYTGVKDEGYLEAINTDTPDVEYYLNVDVDGSKAKDRDYLMSLVVKVREVGAVGINMRYRDCSRQLVEVFHENGLLVSIWTVNSSFAMKRVLTYGADNITTRSPSELRQVIAQSR